MIQNGLRCQHPHPSQIRNLVTSVTSVVDLPDPTLAVQEVAEASLGVAEDSLAPVPQAHLAPQVPQAHLDPQAHRALQVTLVVAVEVVTPIRVVTFRATSRRGNLSLTLACFPNSRPKVNVARGTARPKSHSRDST